jgi:hypothetical protein
VRADDGRVAMVEAVHLTSADEILMAFFHRRITRIGTIGALVEGGRSFRQARALVDAVSMPHGRSPLCRELTPKERHSVWAPVEANAGVGWDHRSAPPIADDDDYERLQRVSRGWKEG